MSFRDTATLGDQDNSLTFNDSATQPYFRALLRKAQFSDIRAFDTLVPEEGGVEDYTTLLGAVNYVIEGKMYPNTQADYENGLRALRSVADVDLEQADPLSSSGYVPYVWKEIDQNKQLFIKVLYASFQETTKIVMPFTLFCKIKTPRIYGTILRTAGTGSSPGTVVGSTGYPFGYPVGFGASYYSITASAVNAGDRGAYPEGITITGPVTNPKFLNQTTGEFIQVNITMGSSDTLSIQYDSDSVSIDLNGNSVYGSKSTDSTLFLVPPGGSVFALQGSAIGAGASATITFLDTWSLG